jgi:hypothetical protein
MSETARALIVYESMFGNTQQVLRRRGIKPLAPPASFFVEDILGPLSDGEVERARQWGRSLAEQLRSAPRRSITRPPVQG